MYPEVKLDISDGFLRPLGELDVTDAYVLGLNDPTVNKYLEVRHNQQTHDSVLSFIKINKYSSNMILWGIWFGKETQERLVGTVRLHEIGTRESLCDIGICLFEKGVWGKGLGTQAINRVTAFAFKTLNLCAVRAGVYVENIGSQLAFQRAGYNFKNEEKLELSVGRVVLIKVYLAVKKDYETVLLY